MAKKVLKGFSWSRDGVNTEFLAKGESVPDDMPAAMVDQLKAEGYIGGKAKPEPTPEPTPEPAPEPTPEPAPEPTPVGGDQSGGIGEGWRDLDSSAMRDLAMELTGNRPRTKGAAERAIEVHLAESQG